MPVWKLTESKFDEHSIVVGCVCLSQNPEHEVRLSFYDDLDDQELDITFHLVRHGFFQRLWTAVRYLVGYRCRYGEWDEVLIGRQEASRIISFLESFVETKKLQETETQ